MQALRHKDPIWAAQQNMADRRMMHRMAAQARRAAILRAKTLRNVNIARALEAKPISEIEVFETEAGQRYYQIMKEGGRVSLPFVSILR